MSLSKHKGGPFVLYSRRGCEHGGCSESDITGDAGGREWLSLIESSVPWFHSSTLSNSRKDASEFCTKAACRVYRYIL